ncbi:SOS response-associated peptidase [Notoacmeibacter ruber]|uniref:Abasic site processing protein n=1 Tax=Notoacmeibacter ruber TaxID=2670375 RepID=A0A3L7JDE3_9HYPH|nr:SOS response-associated peptidase [Notoacmeibacter ruber]RLQ87601.1 SOS response-associated peptidase [Notoacmeibacter ruber]
MCGRFSLTTSSQRIEDHFDLDTLEAFPPRYNIAPTQPILVVMAGDGYASESVRPVREGRLVRWGLIPSWAKDLADLSLMFNARSETAAEKPAFRGPMRHGRVLVPASGFYEWRRSGGKPQPFWIYPAAGEVVAFAGIYSAFMAPDGSEIETAAILTTASNESLNPIHDRMPVTISPPDFERWLDCRDGEPRHIADLLRPAPEDFWRAVPVSDRVNKTANMGPELQHAVPDDQAPRRDAPSQIDLFGE